jgi:hypothetical protein
VKIPPRLRNSRALSVISAIHPADSIVMNKSLRIIALSASGFVLLSVLVLVVNQTVQVVQLASAIHPNLGRVTGWGLVLCYGAMAGVPVVLFLRLPGPLKPPESDQGPEFASHVKALGARLAANPHLAGSAFADRAQVEEGLRVLGTKADAVVQESASIIFVSTAVSQSGRLDAFLVLAAQTRMIWRIAHLYHQRPSLKEMIQLYGNVAGTAFVAGELQDIDLSDQVEPILSSAVSALGVTIPGFQLAGSILASCVLSGSANAFLTLRVGMIAKRYCGALVLEPRPSLRRAATAEAARQLGTIVADGTGKISKAVWRASVDKVGGAVSGVSNFARDAGAKVLAKWRIPRVKEQPEV